MERKEASHKRSLEEASADSSSETVTQITSRPRLNSLKDSKIDSAKESAAKPRWRTHCFTESYVNLVGELMYPKVKYGPYGYNPEEGRFPIDKINTLGLLTCQLRKPLPIERWCPLEIATFEAALTVHGKNFHIIQKYVHTKSVKEIIEFYYDWKKTSHYKQWKKVYQPDERTDIQH